MPPLPKISKKKVFMPRVIERIAERVWKLWQQELRQEQKRQSRKF